jgi:segregation and condensation protein B
MARRKKGTEPEPTESRAGELDDEPTQADAKLPEAAEVAPEAAAAAPEAEAAPEDPAEPPPGDDDGAEVDSPLAGDTEKLFTDEPPVPAPDGENLATVTDIGTAMAAAEASDEVLSDEAAPADGEALPAEGEAAAIDPGRLEAIVESLLFASDKALGLADLKRLLGERDGKKISAAIQALTEKRQGTGIHVTSAAGGWQLRTNPEHAPWVGKLLAGKPMRLSRAMLETMSIVAYRQPVTRPEIDDIRGVDCGPVLKTLLDRGLIRVIGKKEEVGRPMLYGTTPEFLRIFNLRDLAELPTLREFHELGADEKAQVDAEHGVAAGAPEAGVGDLAAAAASVFTPHPPLPPDPEENDNLMEDLERAAQAAARASGAAEEPQPPPDRSS